MKIPAGIEKAIDKVYVVREQIKMLSAEEVELSSGIKSYMQKKRIQIIETERTKAEVGTKSRGAIDPESYYDALEEDFDKFIETVSVRKESKGDKLGADRYLSQEEIENIMAKSQESVSLYIKALPGVRHNKQATV